MLAPDDPSGEGLDEAQRGFATAQLHTRHWAITDHTGHVDHVRGEGVVGVRSGGDVIRLFPGALQALQEVADGVHADMRLAVASSADTPLAESIASQRAMTISLAPLQ